MVLSSRENNDNKWVDAMKLRVKQIGEVYYPQYRRFFIWTNFYEDVGYDDLSLKAFATLEEAKKYANNVVVRIHPIVGEANG